MKLALLTACVTLGVFAIANTVASAVLLLDWRRRSARFLPRPAAALLFYRCLPAAISAGLASLAVLPAFLRHEPRDRVETVALPLALAATAGLAILVAGAVRAVVALARTRASLRDLLRTAQP